FKNISVIKLQVVDNPNLRQVMNKLAALIEKSRVIFVPLDDEPFAVRKSRTLRKIVRNPANEITRVQAVMFEDPRQQRRRRRFSVSAGNDNRPLAANEKFLEQLRQRAVTQLVIEHIFGLGIPSGNRVAYHYQIRLVRK